MSGHHRRYGFLGIGFRTCSFYTICCRRCRNTILRYRSRAGLKVEHQILTDLSTTSAVKFISLGEGGVTLGCWIRLIWQVHVTHTKHQPVCTDVRNFLFYCLHDVQGRTGTSVEDAAKGGRRLSDVVGKNLLSHMLRLHNLTNSILHFSNDKGYGPFLTVFLSIYKGKTKN